jgi:hypothetical protein
MKWMKERDLLIAQSMAFVQSVTGKRPDAEEPTAAPLAAVPVPAAPLAATLLAATPTPASPATAPIAAMPIATSPIVVAEPPAVRPNVTTGPPLPVPTVIEVPPASAAAPAATSRTVPPSLPPELPHFAKLDIHGDFGSEVRARVANFRANQQRFLREREEYCSSTMAKVRAAIRDTNEPPGSGK